MGEIVIDSYPFRRWLEVGTTELPNYKVVKNLLIEKYKVCYFCEKSVKLYEPIDGLPIPNDAATIDHLYPRPERKRYELTLKVLACNRCNRERNIKAQKNRGRPVQSAR